MASQQWFTNTSNLITKNTFLEFNSDQQMAIKASACARSASADSALSRFNSVSCSQRSSTETECSELLKLKNVTSSPSFDATTCTPTIRSPSPSTSESNSSTTDQEVKPYAEFPSPDSTPRANSKYSCADGASNGYPTSMNPFLMPVMRMMMPMPPCEESLASPVQQCETPRVTPSEPASPTMVVSLNQLLESNGKGKPNTTTTRPSSSPNLVAMWNGGGMAMQQWESNTNQKQRQPRVVQPRIKSSEAANQVIANKNMQDLKKPVKHNTEQTLMMRGIPCSITQEELMTMIDEAGLKGKYNFFYLPYDSKKSKVATANLGYAFINLVDQESADLCASTFTGVRLNPFRSPKTCRVSPADMQGIKALWEHFRNKAVRVAGSRGPMFFDI